MNTEVIQITWEGHMSIDMTSSEFVALTNKYGQVVKVDTRLHDTWVNTEGIYIVIEGK